MFTVSNMSGRPPLWGLLRSDSVLSYILTEWPIPSCVRDMSWPPLLLCPTERGKVWSLYSIITSCHVDKKYILHSSQTTSTITRQAVNKAALIPTRKNSRESPHHHAITMTTPPPFVIVCEWSVIISVFLQLHGTGRMQSFFQRILYLAH